MAAFNAAPWIGDRTIRPSDEVLDSIDKRDTGLYQCDMGKLWRNSGYFLLPMRIITTPNGNTKYSPEWTARFPFKVVAAEVACETSAGSGATVDLEKNPSGSPDTYATMSTGAVSVHSGAGDFQDLPILDGSEDVAYGDQLRIAGVGSGSGNVTGIVAFVHCFRL